MNDRLSLISSLVWVAAVLNVIFRCQPIRHRVLPLYQPAVWTGRGDSPIPAVMTGRREASFTVRPGFHSNAIACVGKQPIMVATASTEHSYWLALAFVAWNRKRLRFLRFSFTQRTQRKRLRLNGTRASGVLSRDEVWVNNHGFNFTFFLVNCQSWS